MGSYEWINHKGKKILYLDITCKDSDELAAKIKEMLPVIKSQPKQSILCITNAENSAYNVAISHALRDFAAENKPYMKMSVIIGVVGLKKMLYEGTMLFTGRKNMVLKDSKSEALDFLAGI